MCSQMACLLPGPCAKLERTVGLCFPHTSEINTVVCEVVCKVEGPSELSWRAQHGRKKKEKIKRMDIGCVVEWVQSQLHLTVDENGCLAVLHNRNHMVTIFGNSHWVIQAAGKVQSKSVTSCAGMTAHLVLLAQTRVGFLSGGRGKRMRDLTPTEFLAQLEEAYARATVALTRAQRLCILMEPLDMKGLFEAATVIGCLTYGAGVCGAEGC